MRTKGSFVLTPQKWLVILLRFNAVAMMLAVLAVIMPFRWMAAIHASSGLGPLPTIPIVSYLARSASALYGMSGLLLWIVSCDLARYRVVITVMAACFLVFGVTILAIDVRIGMPLFWILGEGPYVAIVGCLMLWLQRISKSQEEGD